MARSRHIVLAGGDEKRRRNLGQRRSVARHWRHSRLRLHSDGERSRRWLRASLGRAGQGFRLRSRVRCRARARSPPFFAAITAMEMVDDRLVIANGSRMQKAPRQETRGATTAACAGAQTSTTSVSTGSRPSVSSE